MVSQYFWPENFRINDVVAGLIERGHEVTVLTGQPNYPAGRFFPGYGWFKRTRERYLGAEIIRIPLLPRGKGGGVRLALNYLSFAAFGSLFGPLRVKEPHDVIFVFAPSPITVCLPAILIKQVRKIPLVLWVQDLWPESLSATGALQAPWILGGVAGLVRAIYRRCDRILVQSRSFFPSIEAMGQPPEKVLYFPNSAEPFYRPMELPAEAPERDLMPDGFRVMFAGNIGAAQDFATILGAAERLKSHADIHWVIIGDGRQRPWVEEQVKARGLTGIVHLLGRHPVEAMPRFFSLADAMLVTLKRDPIFASTIPAKMQSYLACGRPVIVALDGEGAQTVRDAGAGLVAPSEDPEALAQAVLSMRSLSASERALMGARGLEYFKANFERNMLLDRLEGWMHVLIEQERLCAS